MDANEKSVRALRKSLGLAEDGAQDEVDDDPIVQRVVSTWPAFRPVPADPSAPIDFDTLRSAGPQIPEPFKRGGRYDDLFARLPVGESRALPIEEEAGLRGALKTLRRKGSPKRFALRRLSEEGIGIWRLDDAQPKEKDNG